MNRFNDSEYFVVILTSLLDACKHIIAPSPSINEHLYKDGVFHHDTSQATRLFTTKGFHLLFILIYGP